MELGPPTNPMPRAILRPDNAVRLPRSFRIDNHDRPRAASEDARLKGDQSHSTMAGALEDDSPPRENGTTVPQITKSEPTLLSLEETTELFRSKVEDARQDTEHALAGNEDVSEVVRPKLTLDLGHSKIARLPENVVDIIKTEVERLSLSHNQIWHIPLRFAECSQLRYLNIRTNVFREIPRGVYKLPLLEILDISRNKVRRISKEIKNLTSLRVFSIVHNRVDDLPAELCEMTKLQILKIQENPLRFKLKKVIEGKEAEVAPLEITENEKEIAVTAEIKRYLKELQPAVTPLDVESGGETSEGALDTPKPLKRVMSSRFPVIPSISSSEGLSDLITKSPGQSKPPPIPTRSHYRNISGQTANILRRPGLAPIINGNERNRSNSESVLQASAAARNKRMGLLRKEKPEMEVVEETRTNRLSHLRGFSHGSVLRSRSSNASSAGSAGSSSPSSPRESRKQRLAFVRRLSSLPEHKRETKSRSAVIEGAKSVLYALYQIHPQVSGLINAIKGKDSKRSSLELTFYNASSHVDRLNDALEKAASADDEDEEAIEHTENTVQRDCATCIMAYTHVTAQMQENIHTIISVVDARYVRTLMLLLYGSMIEMKNAVVSFGFEIEINPPQAIKRRPKTFRAAREEQTPPHRVLQTTTPTREPVPMPLRQVPRLRSDTAIQHHTLDSVAAYPQLLHPRPGEQQQAAIHYTGSTLNGSFYNSSISSLSNGNTLHSTRNSSVGLRSRSNSRSTNNLTLTNSSMTSSYANTPRSGEAFSLPPTTSISTRFNPVTGLTEAQEEVIFENIFLALTRAYDSALQAVPIARRQFTRCLEAAEENQAPKEIRTLWSNLIWRCKTCLEVSEALQTRLVNMRLKDPVASAAGVLNGRNDRAFWQLCKTFMQSFVELVTEMKEAKDLRLLAQDIIIVLRPVQKASREAGRLVETSPWAYLTDAGAVATPFNGQYTSTPDVYTSGANGIHGHYAPQHAQTYPPAVSANVTGMAAPATQASTGASPVSVPLPATPLSAALGPAAQATVPTTPASAYTDQFFAGNVFQRADSLLNMPQAGNIPFVNRR
jgi:Leucine-rich repeat (LRR) protein